MTDTVRIRRANHEPAVAEGLADVLLDCVDGGASVSFMHPLPRAKALGFWQDVLASAARGERIVLAAEDVDSSTIVGTVQVVLAMPENQPHRADVAKMLVHRRVRRRGVGAALMKAAEAAVCGRGSGGAPQRKHLPGDRQRPPQLPDGDAAQGPRADGGRGGYVDG